MKKQISKKNIIIISSVIAVSIALLCAVLLQTIFRSEDKLTFDSQEDMMAMMEGVWISESSICATEIKSDSGFIRWYSSVHKSGEFEEINSYNHKEGYLEYTSFMDDTRRLYLKKEFGKLVLVDEAWFIALDKWSEQVKYYKGFESDLEKLR